MPEEVKTRLEETEGTSEVKPGVNLESTSEVGILGKLKTHKWKILGGALGVFILAGAVFSAYKLGQRQIQPTPQPTPTPAVVATPTPDPTANWKTYTNTKYGYSIKYPEGGRFFEIGETTGIPVEEWQAAGIKLGSLEIHILSFENKGKLSSKEYAEKNAPKLTLSNKKTATIGGKSAFQYDYTDIRGEKKFSVRMTTVASNGYIIEIVGIDWSEETDFATYNLMLSTFRFLEEENREIKSEIEAILRQHPRKPTLEDFNLQLSPVKDDWIAACVIPKDPYEYDWLFVFLQKQAGKWEAVLHGTAFGADTKEKYGIPAEVMHFISTCHR